MPGTAERQNLTDEKLMLERIRSGQISDDTYVEGFDDVYEGPAWRPPANDTVDDDYPPDDQGPVQGRYGQAGGSYQPQAGYYWPGAGYYQPQPGYAQQAVYSQQVGGGYPQPPIAPQGGQYVAPNVVQNPPPVLPNGPYKMQPGLPWPSPYEDDVLIVGDLSQLYR